MADPIRYYVVLTPSHPDYSESEPRYLCSGFVSPEDLANEFPGNNYNITDTPPLGVVRFIPNLGEA